MIHPMIERMISIVSSPTFQVKVTYYFKGWPNAIKEILNEYNINA